MNSKLGSYLAAMSPIRVLRMLREISRPMGVRETADLCDLSPRGAKVVLENLTARGFLRKSSLKGRPQYAYDLNSEDTLLLASITQSAGKLMAAERAESYSRDARNKFEWIDPTLRSIRRRK